MIQKAFIIDDDDLSIYLTQYILSQNNFARHIESYYKAKPALQNIIENINGDLPEVIFLDLNMPEMDGWDFLDALLPYECQLERKLRIYIVTSSINPKDKERSGQYKLVSGFIHKPMVSSFVIELKHSIENSLRIG